MDTKKWVASTKKRRGKGGVNWKCSFQGWPTNGNMGDNASKLRLKGMGEKSTQKSPNQNKNPSHTPHRSVTFQFFRSFRAIPILRPTGKKRSEKPKGASYLILVLTASQVGSINLNAHEPVQLFFPIHAFLLDMFLLSAGI